MKRPFIAVTLLFCAGILFGNLPVALSQLFTLASLLAAVFPFFPRGGRIILGFLIFFAGWINFAHRSQVVSPNDLRNFLPHGEQLAVIRGTLEETPRHRVHDVRNREVWSSIARVRVTHIKAENGAWEPAYGSVMTETREYLPDTYFAGQDVEIAGVLAEPGSPLADGLFDYGEFLKQQGIYHEFIASKTTDWKVISSPAKPPLGDRFCRWARNSLALGLPVKDASLELEWALTLGWKAALTEEVSEPFLKASTYHIFAVDGLRIAIVSGIFLTFFRAVGVKRSYAALLTVPVILFYAALTGWPASAVRAIVMILIVFGGWILKRPGDLINSLFAAAFVILIWEPRQIYQAGFQLSFFVVLCIILILPAFEKFTQRLLQPDPLRPVDSGGWWKTESRNAARHVIGLFMTSIAAWLGSIPLAAYYFHLLTPMSGPANMFAVPLCMLVLICNLASLLVVSWAPFVAVLFNHAGWWFMDGIRVTSAWSSRWPGAFYFVQAPELDSMILYYALLVAVFTGWLFTGNWKKIKISGALLVIAADVFIWWHGRQQASITILPLRSSYCVCANGPQSAPTWLIDCGNETEASRVLKPFLQAQGVNTLDNLVLTHGEINYSGGADLICSNFFPRNILASPFRYRSPRYREFMARPEIQKKLLHDVRQGANFGPWTTLLADESTVAAKAKDNLMSLRGDFAGASVLLLGDLDHAGQATLASGTNELHSDILVIAVSRNAADFPSDALLQKVNPQVLIIADSGVSASSQDREEFRRRLSGRNIALLFTSDCLAVTLSVRQNNWLLTAMNGIRIQRGPIVTGLSPP